jgi:hypothetical protein
MSYLLGNCVLFIGESNEEKGTWNLKRGEKERGKRNMEHGIWNMEYGTWKLSPFILSPSFHSVLKDFEGSSHTILTA